MNELIPSDMQCIYSILTLFNGPLALQHSQYYHPDNAAAQTSHALAVQEFSA